MEDDPNKSKVESC